jgi:hypothetical protein
MRLVGLSEHAAAPPSLLPAALTLGAGVVCMAKHRAFDPRLAAAFRALHQRIELQRDVIAANQDRNDHEQPKHGVLRPSG